MVAVTEHPTRMGHLTGVQVVQARNGSKVCHVIKPCVGTRRVGFGERWDKNDFGHCDICVVGVPSGKVDVRVQVIGRARAGAAVVVVVERERRVRRRVAGIGLGSAGAEGTHHGHHQDDQTKE